MFKIWQWTRLFILTVYGINHNVDPFSVLPLFHFCILSVSSYFVNRADYPFLSMLTSVYYMYVISIYQYFRFSLYENIRQKCFRFCWCLRLMMNGCLRKVLLIITLIRKTRSFITLRIIKKTPFFLKQVACEINNYSDQKRKASIKKILSFIT